MSDVIVNDEKEQTAAKPVKRKREKKNRPVWKPSKKRVIIIAVSAAAVAAGGFYAANKLWRQDRNSGDYETVTVERRDIVRSVSGSSTIEANDTYDVTALVTGEILSDTFNEGDIVQKDQLLYTIDSNDAQRQAESARNAVIKAQSGFESAVRDKADKEKTNSMNRESQQNAVTKALNSVESAKRSYNEALDDYKKLNVTSDYSGTAAEVLVKKGDSVTENTQIARIYDSSRLKLRIPFNEADAAGIQPGAAAQVTLASSGSTMNGTVESVASGTTATEAHAIVRYVTISVDNPGALTAGESASAEIGGTACSDLGVLEYYDEGFITAGTSGEISGLFIEKGDYVTAGGLVASITSDKTVNALKNAEDSVKTSELSLEDAYNQLEKAVLESDTYSLDVSIQNARLALEDAQNNVENAEEALEKYEITAPIDGTIITKNKKAGDKLENNNNSSSEPMAVIYDLSVLKVQLTVDESDILNIKAGQTVSITADAVTGRFEGTVTKVGVNGSSESGVTLYPVDIEITEYGDLLPGMNVDCVIDIESAKNVLAVPAEALQRGNRVYVKGEKIEENDNAPDGYRSVKVETGVTDGSYIEIKSGLEEGDEICGAAKATGKEAQGQSSSGQEAMPGGMGGMPGGMGGAPGGMSGAPGGMGGRSGGMH